MAARGYTHAIVARVPRNFSGKEEVYETAKAEHESLVRLLRELTIDVIELPPDDSLPLSVYVEDTAVVVNGSALITRPGLPDRSNEVDTVRAVLKKELSLPLVEMAEAAARVDGGDVLFTGREFFVGLSARTNEGGARAVAAAFPEYPTTAIQVPPTHTHLKSLVTVAGPDVLCVASTPPAQKLLKAMEREASFNYQTITVPEESAANVLYVNGTLIHRTQEEIPASYAVFAEKVDFPRRPLSCSNLLQTGYGLSSCCILIRRSKYIRNL